MKYFTAKGDAGTTKLFRCPRQAGRLSKGDAIFEVLGGLDELNSYLGLCRAVCERASFPLTSNEWRERFLESVSTLQQDLFIIQAELAGSDIRLAPEKVGELEGAIGKFAVLFPPLSSFVVPGHTELAAHLDIARTVARRVERAYVRYLRGLGKAEEESTVQGYLNRLSSLLYVLARFAVYAQGEEEQPPLYR